jgi:holliday junction DNA helicase RuvA
MLNFIVGTVKEIKEKVVTVLVNGIGFEVHVPKTDGLLIDTKCELYTYLHWNQDKGPSFYGFQDELTKIVFLMIISCPKIGPGIAITILSQIDAAPFLEIITSQNETALSAVNGIGAKKAELLIMQLKNKASKLLSSGTIKGDKNQNIMQWQDITNVLTSLNYSKPEVSKALGFLTEQFAGKKCGLDQLIRASLSFLSQEKM